MIEFVKPFSAVLIAFFLSQGLKLITDWREHNEFRPLENGGMPSTHAAMAVSTTIVVLLDQGLGPLFLIALIFTLIVLNDAVNVRWETSRHAELLNKLTGKRQFKVVGHRPIEVLAGILLGIIIPLIIYSFF